MMHRGKLVTCKRTGCATPRESGHFVCTSCWREVPFAARDRYLRARRRRLHGIEKPDLQFGPAMQRLPQWMIERYGYEKARRIGVVAMVGGKDKTRIRNATPEPFRDLLIDMARSVRRGRAAA